MNLHSTNTAAVAASAIKLDPDFPPRGSGFPDRKEGQPATEWAHPWELGPGWNWQEGKVLLGQWGTRLLGDPDQKEVERLGDDRHIVTIAGSRSGKSRTVLIPNLSRYPGSFIVIDPKGELANASTKVRAEKFGQSVVVLDPFQTSKWQSASYNPLSELDPTSTTFIDDVGLVADALIIDSEKDPHWTDSAKSLINAIILYVFATGSGPTLSRVRRVLMGSEGPLAFDNAKGTLFTLMADVTAFGGLVALAGKSFASKGDKEGAAILSTAREQTRFLDSLPMDAVLKDSPVRLRNLKRQPTTIFLCLPAGRLATHGRWLRLVISLAIVELERDQTEPDHPVLLMLEEFLPLAEWPFWNEPRASWPVTACGCGPCCRIWGSSKVSIGTLGRPSLATPASFRSSATST